MADYDVDIKETKQRYIFRRNLSDISLEKFKCKWCTVSWDINTKSCDTNKACDNVLAHFMTSVSQKRKLRDDTHMTFIKIV